ncbi:MAG: hypothetical protein MJ250_08580 [Alphaproteobacteria bacterium]|nr:hypothetical protein [Alphaproteobacteria bacterium]
MEKENNEIIELKDDELSSITAGSGNKIGTQKTDGGDIGVGLLDGNLAKKIIAKGTVKTLGQITVPDDSLYASGHVGIWLPQDSPINS